MDLHTPADLEQAITSKGGKSLWWQSSGEVVLCLIGCAILYGVLYWMTLSAGIIGGIVMTILAVTVGPVASVCMARVSHRVSAGTAASSKGPLWVAWALMLLGVILISDQVGHRIPTASILTGIGSFRLLGPILCIPIALYFWHWAKKLSGFI